MQMLNLREQISTLLAEPASALALKTKPCSCTLIAPDLYRSVDLQKDWGKLLKWTKNYPQAGLAIIGETKGKEQLITKILEEYEKL